MRILVHDFSGHPFQVQLSRHLAARGHEVLHAYCGSYSVGHGSLERQPDDPPTFSIRAVNMASDWQRYSWRQRIPQEIAYGARFNDLTAEFEPDVVLSCNDPLFAKIRSGRWCQRHATPFVFWLQDVYSVAMASYARRRIPVLGRGVGAAFVAVERWLLRHAASVVVITEDFLPLVEEWGVDPTRTEVIPNWAPLDELVVRPQVNDWSIEHGLDGRRVALYAGTLGLKHDPAVLLAVADHLADLEDVVVAVVSEGKGSDWLEAQLRARPRPNLQLLPYQPWSAMPDVLGAASVLLVLLEAEAGVYSVPSKVLTGLGAGRAVVAAVPAQNRAARVVKEAGAGVVVTPGDHQAFAAAVRELLEDPTATAAAGADARAYAEAAFDIAAITERFDALLRSAAGSPT